MPMSFKSKETALTPAKTALRSKMCFVIKKTESVKALSTI